MNPLSPLRTKKAFIALLVFTAFHVSMCAPLLAEEQKATEAANPKTKTVYGNLSDLHLPSIATQLMREAKESEELAKQNEENAQSPFKLGQVKIPTVGNAEKLQIAYRILDTYASQNPIPYQPLANDNVVNDLDIFCGGKGREHVHVFGAIDQTQTTFGKIQLQKMLYQPLKDIATLKHRQEIVKLLVADQTLLDSLTEQLKKIKDAEADVIWFWKSIDGISARLVQGLCYPDFWKFAELNKSPIMLELLRQLVTVLFPSAIGLTAASFTYLSLNPRQFGGYHNQEIFIINAILYTLLFVLYLNTSSLLNQRVAEKHTKINNVATCTLASINLASIIEGNAQLKALFPVQKMLKDVCSPATDDAKYLVELLQKGTFQSDPSFFSYHGRIMAASNLMHQVKESFVKSLITIGQLDAYVSIAHLYKKQASHKKSKYCFVEYAQTDKPYLKIDNFWHAGLNPDVVAPNSIDLGKDNCARDMMVTGPNAGGKSTSLKGISLCVLMAQSFGIAPAQAMTLSPFTLINTYMNITDTTGSESLFQAEMRRTSKLLQMLKGLGKNEFAFVIMDEIFTGTNPKEGQAGAYGVAKKLSTLDNTIAIFATHFKVLTELEQVTNGVVENRKVTVFKNEDGTFTYPYKLEKGITDQAIALDLLELEGFDADILQAAHEVLNKRGDKHPGALAAA